MIRNTHNFKELFQTERKDMILLKYQQANEEKKRNIVVLIFKFGFCKNLTLLFFL